MLGLKRSAIGTLVERTTRFTMLLHLPRHGQGIAIQDSSLQESMGPICDRTKEMLAPTDKGIMMARRKLFKAIKNLQNEGKIPAGVDPERTRFVQHRYCCYAI